MSNLSELDLQNLRHLLGGYDTTHCKMKEYAQMATDTQIKQFFEKGAKSAMENKQQLMKFLQQEGMDMQEKEVRMLEECELTSALLKSGLHSLRRAGVGDKGNYYRAFF